MTISKELSLEDLLYWGKRPFILQAGLLAGCGVTAMHYLGMISVVGVQVSFDYGLVVLSFLLAVFAATAALIILMFIFQGKLAKTLSAAVMGIAVCGMHYTGMAATKFSYAGYNQLVQEKNLGLIVALISSLVCLTLQSLAANQMQKRIKDYAKIRIEAEKDNIETLRHFLALINFHSRNGCSTTALEFFIDPAVVQTELRSFNEALRNQDDSQKRKAEFRHILKHPVAFEVFKDYCVKSFAQENLTFLAEVNYLVKWMKTSPLIDRARIAWSIWKGYLSKESERQVNISSELCHEAEIVFADEHRFQKTNADLKKGRDEHFIRTEKLLNQVEAEIEQLLFTNMFRSSQFLGSTEYKWCKVLLKHLPMPSYETLMALKVDSSTQESPEQTVTALEGSPTHARTPSNVDSREFGFGFEAKPTAISVDEPPESKEA
jgi:hypothetical protein